MLGLDFHHLGLAVRQTEDGVAFLKAMGYIIGERVVDPAQNVQLMMCTHETMPAVEIVAPTGTPGPVDSQLARHSNGVVYHICYSTRDLALSLQRMNEAGLRPWCVSPPKPAVLFNGLRVSFYNILGVGLIEVIEQG